MKAMVGKPAIKRVFSKIYFDPLQLMEAVEITINESTDYELSILGKTNNLLSTPNKDSIRNGIAIKTHAREVAKVGKKINFFFNPEIGDIFITGPLTSIFLNDLEGKYLGALSTGPFGILRGLGISRNKATNQLTALKNGGYLIIIRGYDRDLDILANLLGEKQNNHTGLIPAAT
ncbi:MAG: hypothetical protein GY931_20645 [Maribacter sp.]|nr:hypothetical protein [Maribacter sp.]